MPATHPQSFLRRASSSYTIQTEHRHYEVKLVGVPVGVVRASWPDWPRELAGAFSVFHEWPWQSGAPRLPCR